MGFDRELFASKLQRYCGQLDVSFEELSAGTGIAQNRIRSLIDQVSDPTGDEVLIFADYFKCDFKFFISNEKLAPFEQTELLFRRHNDEISKADRWSVQNFLYLCECESFLYSELGIEPKSFKFVKSGKNYKQHGRDAARSLRKKLDYAPNAIPKDVYRDLRTIGIHVFRRVLENSNISGLYIKHPVAGPSVLINYTEDVYRQRFSAAHEAAHAILDGTDDFSVSFSKYDKSSLVETRANTFAAEYLIPRETLELYSKKFSWTYPVVTKFASELMVNVKPLLIALKENKFITDESFRKMSNIQLAKDIKIDPEISHYFSTKTQYRAQFLLKHGLSDYYVELCFEAHEKGVISLGRMSEMLLMTPRQVNDLARLLGKALAYGY